MSYEEIKAALAPCGLSCEKCFAHVAGDIRKYSRLLKEKLGNFDIYAKGFETLLEEPVLKNILISRKCWIILLPKTARGAVTSNASCLKTVGCAAVTRKNRLISAISVKCFPATEPTLTNTCKKPGCGSTKK